MPKTKYSNTIFTERFKELFDKDNIPYIQLGNKTGVRQSLLNNYYNGKSFPTIENLIKISQYYNVSTDYLLGLSNNSTTDTTAQGVCNYFGINERVVQGIKDNIDDLFEDLDEDEREETQQVLEKVVTSETYILSYITQEILDAIVTKDSDNFFKSAAWKNNAHIQDMLSFAPDTFNYNEFKIYKMALSLCNEIVEELGSYFTEEQKDIISKSDDVEELIRLSETINSKKLKKEIVQVIELFAAPEKFSYLLKRKNPDYQKVD